MSQHLDTSIFTTAFGVIGRVAKLLQLNPFVLTSELKALVSPHNFIFKILLR
jgi:hypothetical protein